MNNPGYLFFGNTDYLEENVLSTACDSYKGYKSPFNKTRSQRRCLMSVSGITGATHKVQIPLAIKEHTPSEERNESQVQKAAEQMKEVAAKNHSSSHKALRTVNLKA